MHVQTKLEQYYLAINGNCFREEPFVLIGINFTPEIFLDDGNYSSVTLHVPTMHKQGHN